MEEILLAILTNPQFELFVIKVVAGLIHKRRVDPAFLVKSDQAFAQWGAAQTEQEKLDAAKALSACLSS